MFFVRSIFLLYISNYRWLGRGPSRSRAQQLCPRIEEEQEGDFFTSAQRKRKQARSWGLAGGVVGPDLASSSHIKMELPLQVFAGIAAAVDRAPLVLGRVFAALRQTRHGCG